MITALKHDGRQVETIPDPDDIDTSLDAGCIVWVDVTDISQQEADRLVTEFKIDELARQDMLDETRRTKVEIYEHHAFIAAFAGHLEPVNLLIGDRWLTTFRQQNEQGRTWPIDAVLARFEQGSIDTIGELVWSVLDALVDDCLDRAGELEEQIEQIERQIFADQPMKSAETKQIQLTLFQIRRELVALQHKVQPLEDIAAKLSEGKVEWVGGANTKEFENLRNHVLRANEQLTGHRELVQSEMDALLALSGQRMNEVMKTMTGWGSILLGSALIAGIYGMNFTHMPELRWYLGYPSAIAMMLLLTGVLFVILRKRDWL
ncbi:MAG TPA: magnesium transporter CorA family protein [Acidimicrobiales bacterium]|nr:magnesium transporter CorA family protein [Acidimicrobiales bacterium]